MSAYDPKRTLMTPSGALVFAGTIACLHIPEAAMRRREFIKIIGGAAIVGRSQRPRSNPK